MNRHHFSQERYNFIFIVISYCEKYMTNPPRITSIYHIFLVCAARATPVIKFIKCLYTIWIRLNRIPRACVSDFFPLRYSYRAHAAAEPSASRKMNRLPRRSLSLRAQTCSTPFHAWMSAFETPERPLGGVRALQGECTLPRIPWVLINRRGSISRVTKFHLSDSEPRARERERECATRAYHYYAYTFIIRDLLFYAHYRRIALTISIPSWTLSAIKGARISILIYKHTKVTLY